MLRAEIDWNALRKSFITLGVTVAVGMMAVSGAGYFLDEQKKQNRQVSSKLRQSQDQLSSMEREVAQLNLYLPRFKAMEERGIIAKTALWKERLKAMEPALRSSNVEYECPVTAPLPANPTAFPLGGFKLMSVAMNKCTLGLRHEGEFFDFMRALNGLNALILPKSCIFTTKGEIKPTATGSNVMTECDLEWFTVNSNEEGWGQ